MASKERKLRLRHRDPGEVLIARLDRVKCTGPGRWIAACPAHDDKRPSLAVRELGDGRVLIHCFAGCAAEAVLASCGLTFSNLYPARAGDHRVRRERQPFNPGDILAAVGFEALVVSVIVGDIAQGKPVSEADRERLRLASTRLLHAAEVARGS